ncbi:MAG: MarR family transcriptional regulator [bacterium]|nr:MarR family transcriptional regulator [bacterium]
MEEDFSILVNYLWKETMKNLNTILSEQELIKFCSNDYFYLSTIQELGRPNFTMIADALQISKPAVSVMIRKLLSMGLVEKEKSEEDRRVIYVELTEKGKQLMKGDRDLYNNLSLDIKSIVRNEEELSVIQTTIQQLAQRIKTKSK